MVETTTRRHILQSVGTTAVGVGLLRQATEVARSQETEQWSQFGYDSANTGYAPNNTAPRITDSSAVDFKLNFEEARDTSSPAVVDGTVYAGNSDGNLYAIDIETGDPRWTFTTDRRITSSPAVADGTVYFSDWNGRLYAIDTASGSEEWTSGAGGRDDTSPIVANGVVYSGEKGFDTESGEQRWVFERFPEAEGTYSANTTAAVSEGTVYLGYEILDGFRDDENTLYAADAESGEQEWGFVTEREIEAAPAVADGTVYVGSNGGVLHAVDAESGTEQWSFQMEGSRVPTSPAVANGTVYTGTTLSPLYAVDADSGEQQWASETRIGVGGSPAIAGDTVYVGDDTDTLHAFDVDSGEEKWQWGSLGYRSSPAIVNGTIYIGGDTGRLAGLTQALSTAMPTATATPTPSSTPVPTGTPSSTSAPTTGIERQSGVPDESTPVPTMTPTPSFFDRFGNALSVLLMLVAGGILVVLGTIYRKFDREDQE